MTAWLRFSLAVQLAFFGVWGARLLTSHDDARIVWLATTPVDPRDLLSGHYVSLRYPIGSETVSGCQQREGEDAPRTVYVRLEETGETMVTVEGRVAIARLVACRTEPPVPSVGETWIAGERRAERPGEIAYGIERFYVPEDSALRTAVSGHVVAKVALGDGFTPRIVDLVRTIDPTVPPAE